MAAQLAFAGLDPIAFLTTEDQDERMAMQAISVKIISLMQKRDQNLATMIASKIWGSIKMK